MLFENLDLTEPILNALKSEGYTHPTPIQQKAIPILLQGRDLLACAQTGTGKTAAFAIPVLQMLSQKQDRQSQYRNIKALVVTPTRELAIQIDESFASYGANLKLKHTVVFGGVSQHSQVNSLRNGIDILIATPGRLLDLINQGFISLSNIEIFILDEADRMLDMGFVNDIKKVIKLLPVKRQSLFFSATMPDSIMALANSILTNPERVEVTPVSSTAETVQQEVYFVDYDKKKDLLLHKLEDEGIKTALVFTRTKHGADKVVKILAKANIKAAAIHGNKSQNARQKALSDFKEQRIRVLVATDIAARGIDIDELAYVINYEIPNIPETYVHRIGRTGRAGASGKAVSFCDAEERAYLRDIQKLITFQIPVIDNHPFPAEVIIAPPKAKQAPVAHNRYFTGNAKSGSATGNKPYGNRSSNNNSDPGKKRAWYGSHS
ncbi:MAG: DEAD/DEAH box helicase [Saprospiraceae bacterium]|nr:DEAD/DEAH box helicase [Saprospiraceae bacterium]